MNNYNPFVCNHLLEAKKAKAMTVASLRYSIDDARGCIANGIDTYNKYIDQIGIYMAELLRRGVK